MKGLAGLSYFNGVTGTADEHQDGDLKLDREVDHIFSLAPAPKHEFAVLDPVLGRAIAVVSSGNTKAVVWNPGPEGKLPDLAADDWRRFVCVEPVSDWPGGGTLAPGARHELLMAIQSNMNTKEY